VATRQSKCERKEEGEAKKKVKEALLAAGINSSSRCLFRFKGLWETTPKLPLHLSHFSLASWAVSWADVVSNYDKCPTRAAKMCKDARIKKPMC
jgi:hypothetical protein